MADNRLFIRCKCGKDYGVCIASMMLGTTYSVSIYENDDDVVDKLNKYYLEHSDCAFKEGGGAYITNHYEMYFEDDRSKRKDRERSKRAQAQNKAINRKRKHEAQDNRNKSRQGGKL